MLEERGKWPTEGLVLECKDCKEKNNDLSRVSCLLVKKNLRKNCDYSWQGLQKAVPESLESVPLITIRRFSRKCWSYMDLYRKGINGKLAEYAVKKYKSHRRNEYQMK